MEIVARAAPGATVSVFGSRATGRHRPFSDLDLLVSRRPPLDWNERADLREAFEASNLPFRVDVVDEADLEPAYRARIERERIVLSPSTAADDALFETADRRLIT